MSKLFEGKRVLVTGGTGSLGQVLVRRLMSGAEGTPESVTVFSRDEAKQHYMRLEFMHRHAATDEVIFENCRQRLKFVIGDIRDYASVLRVARNADVVFSAAALKQVPSCEYFPWEAVRTNIEGAENLVREGIERRRVYVTGNPIKEVLDHYDPKVQAADPFTQSDVEPGKYFLMTAHRAETVDVPERLNSLIQALNDTIDKYDMPILASLHPRTADKMKAYGVDAGKIRFVPPLGLFDFVRLEKEAFCVLSDSGTVQEECCIFGVPTVTMRDVTERPETIECGSNLLAGVVMTERG